MPRSARLVPLFALAAAVAWVPPADPARGCAVVPPRGARVDISAESAVIVWDEATKTEHFIRRARFAATAADFGFLVPTPTAPELAEANDAAFGSLETLTAPRVVYETRTDHKFGCGGGPFLMSAKPAFDAVGAAMPTAPPVEVLKRQRVGQFDAAVLKAEDPKKLRDWLESNGYQARPELVEWLKAYTDQKWIITAFKIAGRTGDAPAAKRDVDATAVRMSFKADKPFYPYREPEDVRSAAGGSRLLRVYFFADRRYAGTLGAAGDWPGRAVWANPVGVDVVTQSAAGGTTDAGRGWWLTEFEDRSSPRPGTDEVFFAPAADPAALERPPVVRTTVTEKYWPGWDGAAALAPVLGIAAVYGLWRVGRRAKQPPV